MIRHIQQYGLFCHPWAFLFSGLSASPRLAPSLSENLLKIPKTIIGFLYNVPEERRQEVTAAVLTLELHTMAADIIQRTIQQAEAGFDAPAADR